MIRKAAIDFGTNTFHLLIVDVDADNSFTEVYRKRSFVYLDRDRSEVIVEDAYELALLIAADFKASLIYYDVIDAKAVATEAFRKKANGNKLFTEIQDIVAIPTEIITGEQEAKLIYEGVSSSLSGEINEYLIMDIGGGSVEFVGVKGADNWRRSLPIGLSVLQQQIEYNGCLTTDQLFILESFLESQLADIKPLVMNMKDKYFVLNAGSAELLPLALGGKPLGLKCFLFEMAMYEQLSGKLILSDPDERAEIEWLPKERNYRLPLFFLLVDYVVKAFNMKQLVYSPAGLKEGLILHK